MHDRAPPAPPAFTLFDHPRLRAQLRHGRLPAGHHVLRQGDACGDVFILRRGLVKLYYVTAEGKEWVKSFIADQGLFGSRRAQMEGGGSAFAALCLEDSEIASAPYAAFLDAVLDEPALARGLLHFNEWLGLKKEHREYALLCRSAEERYRGFLAEEPALAARLTQADIARYLGITPIALSRIKRRLAGAAPSRPAVLSPRR